MPKADRDAEWLELSERLRRFCLQEYGYEPISATFNGPHPTLAQSKPLATQRPLFPPPGTPEPARKSPGPVSVTGEWGSGPEPKHLADFAKVYWPGVGTYTLRPMQREVVRVLWEAWQDGTHDVSQAVLLRASGSQCSKLVDVFRDSNAWNTLVVRAESGRGYYRLPPLPGEPPPDPEVPRVEEPEDDY